MLKIYKNKTTTFKCEVKVESEGSNTNNIKSRLILYPTNDNRNVMYEGVVQDNICTIDINPNINITKNGKAILEIIVDDANIFMPWNSLYEIFTESVKVESAQLVYDANKTKVVVNEIKETPKVSAPSKKFIKKPVGKKKIDYNDLLEKAASMVREDKVDNKLLLKAYDESILSLSREQLKDMVNFVKKDYTPKKETLVWAKKVIGESTSVKSKLLMYCNELKNKGEIL